MAGIYLHIPFCKQACHYCNFHFSTSLAYKDKMITCLLEEIKLRQNYLANKNLTSIYFGGGTPSLLTAVELNRILGTLSDHFSWKADCEITIEANPDDIIPSYLEDIHSIGINRLSIGIQSFQTRDLEFMNRAHTSAESHAVLDMIDQSSINHVSADIIFGTPHLTDTELESNLHQILSHKVDHLSCYALTVEEGTALHHFIKHKKVAKLDDDQSARQFSLIQQALNQNGFEQYEVSNYARNQAYAVHNTNYWKSIPYLGLGPSAHSFNGKERSWNIANNQKYMSSILEGKVGFEVEKLKPSDQYNEFIMTRLRTKWGIPISELKDKFSLYNSHFHNLSKSIIEKEWMVFDQNETYRLTPKGMLYADHIASVLFYISDEINA